MPSVVPYTRNALTHARWYLAAFLLLIALTVCTARPAAAATVEIAPNALRGATSWTSTGCTGGAAMWDCINEASALPNTADFVSAATGDGDVSFDLSTIGLGGGTVTDTKLTNTSRPSTTGCTASYSLHKADGTTISSWQYLGATPGAWNSSYGPMPISLTQSDVDGLYVTISASPDGCTADVAAVSVELTYTPTMTGTVEDTTLCDGVTPVVGIAVNTSKFGDVPCTPGTGEYSAAPTWSAGDTVVAYYDDDGPVYQGANYVRTQSASTTPIANVDLGAGEVRVGSRSATAIDDTDITQFANDDDGDIPLTPPVGFGPIVATARITVTTGTFSSALMIVAPAVWVHSGATYAANGSGGSLRSAALTLNGSGTGTCDDSTSNTPLCIVDTFTASEAVVFKGTGSVAVPGAAYNGGLIFDDSPTSDFQLGSVGGASTLSASFITIGDGTSGATVTTTAHLTSITVSGNVDIDSNSMLQGSSTTDWTIAGNLMGSGVIDLTGGSVDLRSAGADTSLDLSGATTDATFNTLTTSTSSGARTISVVSSGVGLIVGNNLTVGANTTFDAMGLAGQLTVVGNFETEALGMFSTPPLLEIDGDIVHHGDFLPNSGTLQLGGSTTTHVFSDGSGSVYDLDITAANKQLVLQSGFVVDHSLTISGGSCLTPVSITSDPPGAQQIIDTTSATVSIAHASLQDFGVTTPVTATDAVDLGNNSAQITFVPPTSCGTISDPFTNGAATPRSVDGRNPVAMSFVNSTGTTVDRYRSEVTTSPLDSSVVMLLPFDGDGTNRGTTGTATASGGASFTGTAQPNFGSASAHFDGSDGSVVEVPGSTDFLTSTYTLSLWFRADDLGSDPRLVTLAARGPSFGWMHFAIAIDPVARQLYAATMEWGNLSYVATPAAPWLDGQWHNVTMTRDDDGTSTGVGTIRLYMDGEPVGQSDTSGNVHVSWPEPLDIGGYSNDDSANPAFRSFVGDIDDVQMSNTTWSDDEVRGYYLTKRPHAQTLWQSPSYATGTGDALSASCADGDRCADVGATIPDLHVEGARYYVDHQARTTGGMWTSPITSWFETSDSITVTAAPSLGVPATLPTIDSISPDATVTTSCTLPSGCALELSAPSETTAMATPTGPSSIPRLPDPVPPAPTRTWDAGDPLGVGFTVLASTIAGGKDPSMWGTGTDSSDIANLRYAGAHRTPVTLAESHASGSFDTTYSMRMNVASDTRAGDYFGLIQLIAVPTI